MLFLKTPDTPKWLIQPKCPASLLSPNSLPTPFLPEHGLASYIIRGPFDCFLLLNLSLPSFSFSVPLPMRSALSCRVSPFIPSLAYIFNFPASTSTFHSATFNSLSHPASLTGPILLFLLFLPFQAYWKRHQHFHCFTTQSSCIPYHLVTLHIS